MDRDGGNHFDVHVLLPYPEADVLSGRGIFFQIDGNFHFLYLFDYMTKVNKFPNMFPYIPKKLATN